MTNPNPDIVDLTISDEESEGPLHNTPHIKQERDAISPDKRKARSNSPGKMADAGFPAGHQTKKPSWRDHMKKKAQSGADSTAHTKPQMKQKDGRIPSHKRGPSSQIANAVQTGASPAKKARATCSPGIATNATCKAESNITEASSIMKPNKGGSLLGLVRQIKHKQSSQIDEENPPDPKSFNSRRPHVNDDSQVEKERQIHVQEEEEESRKPPAAERVSISAHGDVALNPSASSPRESSKKRNLPDSKDDNQDQGSTDETPCGSPSKRSRTDHGAESRAAIFLANDVGSPRRKSVLVRQDPRQIEKICFKSRKVLKTFTSFKEAADAATRSTNKTFFIYALENYRMYGHVGKSIYNGYIWRFEDEVVARGRVEEDQPKMESLQLDNAPIKLNGGITTQKKDNEISGAAALIPTNTNAGSPEESTISRSSSQKSFRDSSPSFGSPAGDPRAIMTFDEHIAAGPEHVRKVHAGMKDRNFIGKYIFICRCDECRRRGIAHAEYCTFSKIYFLPMQGVGSSDPRAIVLDTNGFVSYDQRLPTGKAAEFNRYDFRQHFKVNHRDLEEHFYPPPFQRHDLPESRYVSGGFVPPSAPDIIGNAAAVTIEAGQSPAVGLKTTGLDDDGGSKGNAAGDHFPGAEHGDGGDVVAKRDNVEDNHSDDDGNKNDNALFIVGEAEEVAKDGDATGHDEISHKSRDLLTDESQDGAVSAPIFFHGDDDDSTRVVETSQEEEDDLDAASTTSHHTGPDSYSDDPIQSEVESSLSSPSHKYLWLLTLLSTIIVSLLLVVYFHFKCGGLGNIMKIIMDIVKKFGYQKEDMEVKVPTPSPQPTASIFYPPALPWNVQKWL